MSQYAICAYLLQIFACLLTILQERGAYLLRPSPQSSLGSNTTAGSNKRLNRHKSTEFPPGTNTDGTSIGVSSVARQVVCGVDALLREEGGTVAMEFPSPRDWQLILGLLEVCGAGAFPITLEELEGLDLREGRGDMKKENICKLGFQTLHTYSCGWGLFVLNITNIVFENNN